MAKNVIGDSACPSCRAHGRDRTGNHLMHFVNTETKEKWVKCGRCNFYELLDAGNSTQWEGARKEKVNKTPEEIKAILDEISEYPVKALTSRGITHAVAARYGVHVAVSQEDGETPVSHYYPKTIDGITSGYKVRNLEFKAFWSVGKGTGCDFFGMNQALLGDTYSKKLLIFEDELSAMSGFQAIVQHSTSSWKPAVVSLPDGAGSASNTIARCRKFIEGFEEITVCMDNDEAGEDAVAKIRAMLPDIKVARIPKGLAKDGKTLIKDANDLLMEGRTYELHRAISFNAQKESPAGASTVQDCLEDALRKPEWGLSYPWDSLTKLTFGLREGELIAVGGGVGGGKTLIAHELTAHLINKHKKKVGVFMLEETPGNTLKNIAGKSANVPFHRPDIAFDPDQLRNEILKYDGSLFLYKNFGQNDWEDIERCIRFWVTEHGIKYIFLDNITALVSHLTATEINTEVAKISVALAGLCNELNITTFVFSHLNPPKSGCPHEEGGQVQEVQFTGSRGLMRYSQLILGFERNKQGLDDEKNLSQIRVLKDRNFGQTGVVPTVYDPKSGRLEERPLSEYDPQNPFKVKVCAGEDKEKVLPDTEFQQTKES